MKTAAVNASIVLLLCAPAALEQVEMGVAVGPEATAGRGDGVAIGHRAEAKGFPGIAGEAYQETLAIGADAKAEGWRCTAVGARARAGVVSATALGRGTLVLGHDDGCVQQGGLQCCDTFAPSGY